MKSRRSALRALAWCALSPIACVSVREAPIDAGTQPTVDVAARVDQPTDLVVTPVDQLRGDLGATLDARDDAATLDVIDVQSGDLVVAEDRQEPDAGAPLDSGMTADAPDVVLTTDVAPTDMDVAHDALDETTQFDAIAVSDLPSPDDVSDVAQAPDSSVPPDVSRCDGALSFCGGACTDLQSSPRHCGACDHDCAGGRCNAGRCEAYRFVTIPNATRITSLAYDGTWIYSGRYTDEGIVRVRADGTGGVETVVPRTGETLALQVHRDRVYWSWHYRMRVQGQPIAGGTESGVNFGGRVGAFAVDDESIYTVDYGDTNSIVRRQPLDGGAETIVATIPSRGGEAIIRVGEDHFVGTQFSGDLYRVPGGANQVEVFASMGIPDIQQLTFDERYIYASSGGLPSVVRVHRGTRRVSSVVPESRFVSGIVVTPTMLFYAVHLRAEIWAIRKPRD